MLIALLRDRKQARMTEFTQAKVEDAKARAEANECNLGLMHASDGAAKDICMTKAWARVFRLAADQGYALPQTYLDTEAEVLFRLAADRGYAEAQYYLGSLFGDTHYSGNAKDNASAAYIEYMELHARA